VAENGCELVELFRLNFGWAMKSADCRLIEHSLIEQQNEFSASIPSLNSYE
jgi:hypothetical protein